MDRTFPINMFHGGLGARMAQTQEQFEDMLSAGWSDHPRAATTGGKPPVPSVTVTTEDPRVTVMIGQVKVLEVKLYGVDQLNARVAELEAKVVALSTPAAPTPPQTESPALDKTSLPSAESVASQQAPEKAAE